MFSMLKVPTPTSIIKSLIWFYFSSAWSIIKRFVRRLLGLKEPEGFVEGQINKTAKICMAATENVTNMAFGAADMVGQGLMDTQECIGDGIASVGNFVGDAVHTADIFHIGDNLPSLPFGGALNHVKKDDNPSKKKEETDSGFLPSFGLFGGKKGKEEDEEEKEEPKVEKSTILPSFSLFGNAKEKVEQETKKKKKNVEPEKSHYLPSFGNLFSAAMEKDENEKNERELEKEEVVEPEKSKFLPSFGGMFGKAKEKVEEKVEEEEEEKSKPVVGGFLRRRFF